jgi:hypothetical protein
VRVRASNSAGSSTAISLATAVVATQPPKSVSLDSTRRLMLTRIGAHRFALKALAARSFTGRYGVLQRFTVRTHRWISVRRVFFTRAFSGFSPTITSRASFRARFGGTRIRVFARAVSCRRVTSPA